RHQARRVSAVRLMMHSPRLQVFRLQNAIELLLGNAQFRVAAGIGCNAVYVVFEQDPVLEQSDIAGAFEFPEIQELWVAAVAFLLEPALMRLGGQLPERGLLARHKQLIELKLAFLLAVIIDETASRHAV